MIPDIETFFLKLFDLTDVCYSLLSEKIKQVCSVHVLDSPPYHHSLVTDVIEETHNLVSGSV